VHLSRPGVLAPVLASLALLVSGCGVFGGGDSSSSATATPSPSSSSSASPSESASSPTASGPLAAYEGQKLTWKSCRGTDECSTLRVPLDYAKPSGRSIRLSLLRVPAKVKAKRIGSLVINPGGPGGSGIDYAAAATSVFGDAILDSYDVVGFDPRGVGTSTPVECGSDALLDRYVDTDPSPDTTKERLTSDRLLRQVGDACLKDSGQLARHVSTIEVAKDLDVLRSALGEQKLDYFGASYGTFIGATYANLFPTHVGRMVLDGALDPTSTTLDVNLVQAKGFETALRAYVADCVSDGDCFLGSSVDRGIERIQQFLSTIEAKPMTTSDGRTATIGDAFYAIALPLYNKASWPVLSQLLGSAFSGDASLLMQVADQYLDRDSDGHFTTNSFAVFNVVSCLDRDDGIPSGQVARYLPRFEKASPTFGSVFAYSASACSTWPIHSGREPAPVTAAGSPPIVVVGTTRDPATPLVWAKALAKQLPRGVLITRNGDGHTGYRQGSQCVDTAVENYLVKDTVPKSLTCS